MENVRQAWSDGASSTQGVQAQKEAVERPVWLAVSRLESQVKQMAGMVLEVEQRLKRVLSPAGPSTATIPGPEKDPSLAGRLNAIGDDLVSSGHWLAGILSRLEV